MLLNLERARATMERDKLDALVAALPENVVYLTDSEGHLTTGLFSAPATISPSYFAILPARADLPPTMIGPASIIGFMVDQPTWMPEVRMYGDAGRDIPPLETLEPQPRRYAELLAQGQRRKLPGPARKALVQALTDLGLERGRLAVDDPLLRRVLQEQELAAANLVDGYETLRYIRAVKTPEEIDRLRKASEANEAAFARLLEAIRPGVSWRDLKIEYETTMIRHDAVPRFWGAGSGPDPWRFNLFQAESPAMQRKVREGDMIKLDIGGTYRNYWADTNRSAVVKGGIPEWFRKVSKGLRAAREAYSELLRPGTPMGQVVTIYEQVMWDNGLPEFRGAWGHGLGLQCYDYPSPRIQRDSQEVLEENMVLNLEGGPAHIGLGAHSLENTYRVTKNGFERWSSDDGLIVELG